MKFERGISHTRSVAYLAVVWGVAVGAIALVAVWPNWLTIPLALLCISSRQSALLVIVHECWHYSMFRQRWLNNVVGTALSGWTVGSSYLVGRRRHLAHHRLLGHHDDPDFEYHSSDGKQTGKQARQYFLSLVFGRQLKYMLFLRRGDRHGPRDTTRQPTSVAKLLPDLAGIAVMQLVVLTTLWLLVGWWAYPVLWMAPLVTLTTLANGVRAFVEHYSFEGDNVSKDDRLFSITAPWYERAFFAPMNFNFHAEHHLQPAVSAFRLPQLRDPYVTEGRLVMRRGYLGTLLAVLFPNLSRSNTADTRGTMELKINDTAATEQVTNAAAETTRPRQAA